MKRIAIVVLLTVLLLVASFAYAAHTGASVSYESLACGETHFSAVAENADGTGVTNMYLVVEANDQVQYSNIPIDGSSADLNVGPFFEDTTVYWRVFGGAERNYDQPLWNGYGTANFGSDIVAYANSVGGYSWVIAGTDDPNPFTTWNEVAAEGCPLTKAECKDGGWQALGFPNQGQCIRYVNTEQN